MGNQSEECGYWEILANTSPAELASYAASSFRGTIFRYPIVVPSIKPLSRAITEVSSSYPPPSGHNVTSGKYKGVNALAPFRWYESQFRCTICKAPSSPCRTSCRTMGKPGVPGESWECARCLCVEDHDMTVCLCGRSPCGAAPSVGSARVLRFAITIRVAETRVTSATAKLG